MATAKKSAPTSYKKVFTDMTTKASAAMTDAKKMATAAASDAKGKATAFVTDAQGKAKVALAKSSAVASEVGEFSKGNVLAVVESGKILANGMKAMGEDYVAESKDAFDTMTGDFKALAAVKSPTELFQLQGKLARRNFDHAVAFGSKTSESLVKLANEAFTPISSRVSLAVDKFSKAA